MSVIYKIVSIANNKIYVGQSQFPNRRFSQHKCDLKHNRHSNTYLQDDYNKYGEKNFRFEIIDTIPDEKTSRELLDILEKKYINLFKSDSREYGYNIESGGVLSKDIAESTKEKLREKNKGKRKGEKLSEETKALMRKNHSHYWLGRKMSDEARLNMSIAQSKRTIWRKGFKQSAETIKKRIQHQYGRIWVHNDTESRFIMPEEKELFLQNGYILGRPFKKRNRSK